MSRSIRSTAVQISCAIILITLAIFCLTLPAPLWAQQTAVKARAAKGIHANSTNVAIAPAPGEVPVSAEETSAAPAALSPADKALVETQMQFLQQHRISAVEDWTTKAVVASDPGLEEDAIKNGTHDHWLAVVNEPRYIMHALQHHLPVRGPGPSALLKFEQNLAVKSGETWVDKDTESEPASLMKARRAASHSGSNTRDWSVALGAAGVAPAMFPAKFDYDMGALSCLKDYLVVGVNAAGSATQPEIVGINNVYSFCNGGTPTVMFAYHTAYNGTVKTSVTLSLDGTKIAFIESLATTARLHVLTLGTTGNNGTVAAPAVPGTGNNAVDTSLVLEGSHTVTRSSLFVDYNEDVNAGEDTGFVGDDGGLLHQVRPVFTGGTPVERIGCGTGGCQAGGWPLFVSGGYDSSDTAPILSGPSYDPMSKNVFFGTSGVGGGLEFYARTLAASTGVCVNDANTQTGAAPCIGGFYVTADAEYFQSYGYGNNYNTDANSYGDYQDPPLVDLVTGYTFWATGQSLEGYGVCANGVNGAPLITEISTTFATNPAIECGGLVGGNHLHLGTFDNAYYNSTATGNLWMGWGDSIGTTAGIPALAMFCFGNTSSACVGSGAAAGVIGKGYEIAPTGHGALCSTAMDASPVTETYDPYSGIDWLTISVASNACGGTGTSGGCIWADNISPSASPITCTGAACSYIPWTPNTAYGVGSEIVDTNGNLQAIVTAADAGISSAPNHPTWNASGTTMDGTPAAAVGYGTVVTNNIVPIASAAATGQFTMNVNASDSCTGVTNAALYLGSTHTYYYFFDNATCYAEAAGEAGSVNVYIASTAALTAQNLVAAINGSPQSACGQLYTGGGTYNNTCYTLDATTQPYVTAALAGNTVTLTAKVAGTAGNCAAGATYPGTCYTTYGWATYESTDTDISPTFGGLSGGVGSTSPPSFSIDGVAISASEPTAASQIGTFTANPSTGSVVITNGANSETITPSVAVGATAIGTFTGSPCGGATTITNGANTMSVLANCGAAASATGTFSGQPTNGQTAAVGGTDAVTASAALKASATGTFTADPNLGSAITITNGANFESLTPSVSTTAATIATFSGTPIKGQGATITNGANVLSLMATPGSPAGGEITIATNPLNWTCPLGGSVTVGGVSYTFVCGAPTGLNQVEQYYSSTAAVNEQRTAWNLWAVLTGTAANCYTAGCTYAGQTANPAVVADFMYTTTTNGAGSNRVVLTATTPGTAGNFTLIQTTGGSVTTAGGANGGGGPNACGDATDGTFVIGATTAASATNFGAAINACNTAYPAIGVIATVGTGANTCDGTTMTTSQVCVQAATAGPAGNAIGLGTVSGATSASGTAIALNCGVAGGTIVIGGTTYTWKATPLTALNQILLPANPPSCTDEAYAGNLAAVVNADGNLCNLAGSTCVYAGQARNGQMYASFTPQTGTTAGDTVALAAYDPGTVGNAYTFTQPTGTAVYTFTPATGLFSGGANGASNPMTGFAWSGCTPATTLCGGSGTGTTATTYAIDGVAADDAHQLCIAINTAPNPANVGVTGTWGGGTSCTVTASTAGAAGNGITLGSNAANYTWSGATLTGGNDVSNVGANFAVTDVTGVALTTTVMATNFAAALTRNIGAVGINPVTSAANVATVTASTPGTAGDSITLASGLSNFVWNPTGTLSGGAAAVNTGPFFATDGVVGDNATNLAAAITRNTSVGVPVTATASGAAVTVIDTMGGTAGNAITLSLPATSTAAGGFNFSSNATSFCSTAAGTASAIIIGGITYNLMDEIGSTTPVDCYSCFYDWAANSCITNTQTSEPGSNVLIGGTAAQTAQNLAAAINQSGNASCATTGTGAYGYGAGTCYYGMALNTRVSAVASGSTVTLTAKVAGAAGNCNAGAVYSTVCDTNATYGWAAQTAADLAEITQSWGGLQGGSSTALTGYSWTFSTGAPPCNGVNNPCNMGGGTNGVTSATTFAVDGVLADDATQLAAAMNTAPNPANVGVTATSAGAVVTASASNPGTGGDAITVSSTAPGYTWNGATLAGGSNGITNGTNFAFWGGAAELNAGAIAQNMVTAINSNATLGTLNPGIAATNTSGSGCASNCEFTVTASSNGAAGDYPLATTFANTTFYWDCPAGTSTTAMCGGANGVIWTYQSPGNGESSVQRPFGTSGMVMETLDFASWLANTNYAIRSGVTDSNGNNQMALVGGTSGATTPAWSTAPGGITHDGTVSWQNIGEGSAANLYLGTGTSAVGQGGDMAVSYTVHGLQ